MGIPLKVLSTSKSSSPVTMRSTRAAIAHANTASSSASREIGLSSWRETPVVKQHLFSAAPSGQDRFDEPLLVERGVQLIKQYAAAEKLNLNRASQFYYPPRHSAP